MTKLKTFRAGSMPQALAQVKRDLGPDAVIVNTRTFKQGGLFGLGRQQMVEVSARRGPGMSYESRRSDLTAQRMKRAYGEHSPQKRYDRSNATTAAPPRRSQAPTVGLDEDIKRDIGNIKDLVENLVKEQRRLHGPNMPEPLFEMYLNLIQQEVADELARELLTQVQRELTADQLDSCQLIRRKLAEVLEKMVSTTGPVCCNLNGQPRTVALIGPTGVGKTTTIAKLAAHYTLRQHKKVGLITIDTYRIGAVDQLRMYAQIIDVPLKVVLTPAELAEAIALMEDRDVIFIDTAGRSQNDSIKMKELGMFLNAVKPDEIHLVLSSTGQHSHLLSAAEKFKALGINRVIFTKLDEAIGFGVVFSVLRKIDASLSYVTTGQSVPEDIEVGSGRQLAQILMGTEYVRSDWLGEPQTAVASTAGRPTEDMPV